MNIPDEVQKTADDLYWDRENQYGGFGCAEEAYEYVAEWAWKEALAEAAQSIHNWASVSAWVGPEGAYFARIFEARIRALAKGDN